MIDLSAYIPSVKVLLDNGVYALPAQSATGKTFLYYALRDIREFEPVDAYTYKDGRNLEELLTGGNLKLILLDRYDMYPDSCVDEIKTFGKSGVVLIDCKSNWPDLRMVTCSIDLSEAGVVIS